ncbi:DUF1330 domain-containing protein [Sandaracinobacteroides saxicola]|uniref:DUF1330 domain-containing protein n=1 Tax=Sandaracinobacteroides saxicola TaxID=2759707 RepID=A0A7G5II95_9SPHN|nr:DUF1330 domain-containing protein [Sandaracinobacteroides saxicola]QMW23087.1 DUF1330 domain-containing protein [Sandaracinobacteroides saxicola]
MTGLAPSFLILKSPSPIDHASWVATIEAARGTILAASEAGAVDVLEPGTIHTSLLIARFAWAPDLDAFWAGAAALAAGLPAGAQVLGAAGLAWEGWPGHPVPTIATVTVPASDRPRAYMLIEGTGHDEAAMDAYRDVILPMLRERGGYYPLFELGGSVRVLHGNWGWGILAISRWPDIAAAQDFWFSERYQTVAIPIRTGKGDFEVQLTAGIAG